MTCTDAIEVHITVSHITMVHLDKDFYFRQWDYRLAMEDGLQGIHNDKQDKPT